MQAVASRNGRANLGHGLYAEVVTITPEMAREWLERLSPKQRRVRPRHVARLVKSHQAGDFMLNGAPIILDELGFVIDGQHRLWMVVESGIPVTILVVSGVSPQAFMTLDDGSKRTGSDMLRADGEERYSGFKAASVRLMIAYEERRNSLPQCTNAEIVRAWSRFPGLGECIDRLSRYQNKIAIPVSIMAVVNYIGRRHGWASKTDRFVDSYYSMASLPPGSPALALVRWSASRSCTGTTDRMRTFKAARKALVNHLTDVPIQKFVTPRKDFVAIEDHVAPSTDIAQ